MTARARPCERSTGPGTPEGKARSRVNALGHGERSAEAVAERAMFTGCLRMLRENDRDLADLTRHATELLD